MAYIGSSPTKVVSRQSANIFTYTATANQTAFTGSDANGNTLACTPSDIMVHMNGIKLEESDYTASTTTVTLGSGAAAGDEVTITAFVTFETADAYTKSASDTRYVNATGDTISGKTTISASGTAGSPTLNVANTTGNNSFNHSIETLSSSLGAGNTNLMLIGKEPNSFNSAWLGYEWNSNASSTNNYLTFGHWNANHLWTMNGAGHIQTPNNPAFNVRAEVGQTLGTTWQKIGYNHTLTQRGGSNYSTTNSRFTAPVTGYYQFNATWTANTNADTDGTMTFWINGAVPSNGGTVSFPTTSPNYDGHAMSACFPLSANDYVEVYRYSTVSTTSRNGNWMGFFSGFLVG